ncbi:MAG TPA: calcium-binding protein [Nocardioides sp.]|nr:calcium-binding protein [Nocardioides sp.]
MLSTPARLMAASGVVAALLTSAGAVAPAAQAAGYTCNGLKATIVGTKGPDKLKGTEQADVIVSLSGKDHVKGNGGDDVICLGDAADVADGGAGNDTILAGAGTDYVSGTEGFDTVQGNGGADTLFLSAPEGDDVNGGPGDDNVSLAPGPEGTVSAVGAGGTNQLFLTVGGSGLAIKVDQGTRQITIAGRTGAVGDFGTLSLSGDHTWTYNGTDAQDALLVGPGPVTASLKGGDDWILTGDANDSINGGAGTDTATVGGGSNHCISVETVNGDCPLL